MRDPNETQARGDFLQTINVLPEDKIPTGIEGAVIRQFQALTRDCEQSAAAVKLLSAQLEQAKTKFSTANVQVAGFADLLWKEEKKRRADLAASAKAEAEEAARKAAASADVAAEKAAPAPLNGAEA